MSIPETTNNTENTVVNKLTNWFNNKIKKDKVEHHGHTFTNLTNGHASNGHTASNGGPATNGHTSSAVSNGAETPNTSLFSKFKKKVTEVSDDVSAFVVGVKDAILTPKAPTIPQLTYVPQPQPKPLQVTHVKNADTLPSETSKENQPVLKKSPSMPDLGDNELADAEIQEVKQGSVSATRNPSSSAYVVEDVEEGTGTTVFKHFKSAKGSGIEKHKTAEALDIGLDALDIDWSNEEATVVYIKKPNMERPKIPTSFVTEQNGNTIYDKKPEGLQPVKVKSKSGKHEWHLAKFVPWTEDPYKVVADANDSKPLDPYAKLQEVKKQKALEAELKAKEDAKLINNNPSTAIPEAPKPVESTAQKILNFLPSPSNFFNFVKSKATEATEKLAGNAQKTETPKEKPDQQAASEASKIQVEVQTTPTGDSVSMTDSILVKEQTPNVPASTEVKTEVKADSAKVQPSVTTPGETPKAAVAEEAKTLSPAAAPVSEDTSTEKTPLLVPAKKIRVTPKPAPKSFFGRLWAKVKSFAAWVFSGFKAVFHTIFFWTKPKATKLGKQKAQKGAPQITQ